MLLARPDLSFHVLTNGQHFQEADGGAMNRVVSAQGDLGYPLYSRDKIVMSYSLRGVGLRALSSCAMLYSGGIQNDVAFTLVRVFCHCRRR